MSSKATIMLGMVIGSTVGGVIPEIFGVSMFSFWSAITSAVGGLIGVYISYKLIKDQL